MRICTLTLAVVICMAAAHADGNWPAWRGPTAEGVSDAAGLPLRWSETENIVWKTGVHDLGYSSPVVWGDQIWLTTAKEDGTALYAVCIDLNSGSIVRDIELFRPENPQAINPLNSYATPSAVIEAGRVYVHYGTFGTACIDTASGEILWKRSDLNCDHRQGPASSPVLFEDLVIITLEGVDKQFTAALNKNTGATVWLYNRPADVYTPEVTPIYRKSFQTPAIIEVNGKQQLVSNGALLVTGHDPRTGEEIWRVRCGVDSSISSVVHGHGLLFVNAGAHPGESEFLAIREGGTGDVLNSHVVWKMTKNTPFQSSPVLVGDLLYMVTDDGILTCTEATTGTAVWSERLKGKYGASPLAATDRIYISNGRGMTTVFAPERQYRELAVNQLDGELWTSPAVADKALLLRTKTHLYKIAQKD